MDLRGLYKFRFISFGRGTLFPREGICVQGLTAFCSLQKAWFKGLTRNCSSLRTLHSCGVLVDWGGSLVEWSFMVTQYNPVDGVATRSYVQMVSSWCYHCFAYWGEGRIRR